jgi:hypothetical protein
MKTAMILCSLLTLPAGAAFAADSPWNGTWRLDESKSQLTGGTMTFSKGAGDMLHFSDGSTASFDFAADGKERKAWANRTAIWTAPAKNTWDTVYKLDGKVLAKGHRTLSEDGKTLTETWTGTRPDGSAFHEEDVFTRVSGTEGLVGTWRASKVKGGGGPQEFVISFVAAGVVHYDVPDMKASAEGRTDGSDNALTGPTVPPGATISFKALTPTKMRYVMKIDGKIDSEGEQTLAADHRSFTDVNWTPGKEDEKTTGVYVKQ